MRSPVSILARVGCEVPNISSEFALRNASELARDEDQEAGADGVRRGAVVGSGLGAVLGSMLFRVSGVVRRIVAPRRCLRRHLEEGPELRIEDDTRMDISLLIGDEGCGVIWRVAVVVR
jgi:hypothetical protein